ncbi:MAG: NAD+ synthase [Hydrogenophilales bacterium 28-61-11]|nr:MAG: NAD+ synthase [Hydrogenophilales bacterium 28-61-11]
MKLAIAQLNLVVGDIAGNTAQLLTAAHTAQAAGASLLLTPEMSICGYPAEDLVLRADFCAACEAALNRIVAEAPPELALIVGYPERSDGSLYNAVALVRGGKVEAVYRKHYLPNHSVFDEQRVFDSDNRSCVFACDGIRFGLNICGDIWEPGPARWAKEAGAEWLLVPNASPFHLNKQRERYAVARSRQAESAIPIVYANLVGGQDELVFDGASFVMDAEGEVVVQLPCWQAGLFYLELDGLSARGERVELPSEDAAVYDALVLAVRDYVGKNGFKGIHLGLSGGIDSALTLAIAVDALGADTVHAVMMPSDYTSSISIEDSRDMVQRLGVRYSEIAIKPVFDAFLAQLAGEFAGRPADTTEENLQARTRGTLLMALSNKFGSLVLTTGNKSEMATGYATLYGDMAGGFAVLKDVPKTRVFRLALYRNGLSAIIPQRIIDRPPSAELRPDQTDQDSLPPYETLDAILAAYVERDLSACDIVAQGFDPATVKRVIRMVDLAEYKRRQAAPGPRITPRNFGKDRRYPITSKYRPEGVLS